MRQFSPLVIAASLIVMLAILSPKAAVASDECIFIVDRDKRYLCQGDCTFIVDRDIRNLCKGLKDKNQQQSQKREEISEQDSTRREPHVYVYPKLEAEQGSDDSGDDHYFPSDNEQMVSKRAKKDRR